MNRSKLKRRLKGQRKRRREGQKTVKAEDLEHSLALEALQQLVLEPPTLVVLLLLPRRLAPEQSKALMHRLVLRMSREKR
jgi:hypothetical protein